MTDITNMAELSEDEFKALLGRRREFPKVYRRQLVAEKKRREREKFAKEHPDWVVKIPEQEKAGLLKIIKTIEDRRSSRLWALGDLLVKIAPPSKPNSYAKLKHAALVAQQEGLEDEDDTYSLKSLRKIRDTAARFPSALRDPELSFDIHREARTPEFLKECKARLVERKSL